MQQVLRHSKRNHTHIASTNYNDRGTPSSEQNCQEASRIINLLHDQPEKRKVVS